MFVSIRLTSGRQMQRVCIKAVFEGEGEPRQSGELEELGETRLSM